jgi:hypothetical protein
MNILVLGKLLGTADDCEIVDDVLFQFYDFVPDQKFSDKLVAASRIAIDYEKGFLECFTEEGESAACFNLLELLCTQGLKGDTTN